MDHFELIAATENAKRQHAGGMDDFAWNIDRHIADHLAAGFGVFPLARRGKIQIFEKSLTARYNVAG